MIQTYWDACATEVATLRLVAPTTSAGVIDVLRRLDPQRDFVSGDAFWSPANGGEDLGAILTGFGWAYEYIEAEYHWKMTHPDTGDRIEYVEGDVYAR